jgi:hypothetical protein
MEGGGKFVLRPGGFAVFFFGALSLLFFWGLWMALRQGRGDTHILIYLFGIAVLAGFPVLFYAMLFLNKVEISGGEIRARFLFGRGLRTKSWRLPLEHVNEVILGSIGQLKKRPGNLLALPHVREAVDGYENLRLRAGGFSASMRPAVQFTPLIVVRTKNPEESRVIITKPFSRAGCRKLMAELRRQGISVSGDEKL